MVFEDRAGGLLDEAVIVFSRLVNAVTGTELQNLHSIDKEVSAVSVETIEKRSTIRKHAPRYRVLLHNDDYNSMEHVVQTLLQTVASLTTPQAVDIMMQAHTQGVALVITCAQEHAEFYSETLKTHGLLSTIEPDE